MRLAPCKTTQCYLGFETISNPQAAEVAGSYKAFLEVFSFAIFSVGVVFNTFNLVLLGSLYPNQLDPFDAYLMNLSFGELVASFGLSLMFFVEFTDGTPPLGNSGCRFLTWFDVTSVTITITSLVVLFFNLYKSIYSSRIQKLIPRKALRVVLLLWFIASFPGLPYMATAEMYNGYCRIGNWSAESEILYICAMIFFQCIIPIAIVVFLFIRTYVVLRSSVGNAILIGEETNQGTVETYRRRAMIGNFKLITSVAIVFFVLLVTVSFMELALALDMSNIKEDNTKYSRIRELASLLLCLKTVCVPMCYFCFCDKLRDKFMRCCFRRRDPDIYAMRYDVCQQSVSEGAAALEDKGDGGEEEDEEGEDVPFRTTIDINAVGTDQEDDEDVVIWDNTI